MRLDSQIALHRRAALLLGVIGPALGLGCPAPSPSEGTAGRLGAPPPIVLLTIDTLRRDHLGLYGHFQQTSPTLDAFAREAVVFERAWSTSATTLPSHVSMLTSTYPHQHGAFRNNTAFESSDGLRSVAELLRDAGYETAGFVSAAPLKRWSGIDAGFDVFDEPEAADRECTATVEQVGKWLRGGPQRPFFLWVHLWEPHAPNRPNSFHSGFAGDSEYEHLLEERRIDVAALPELPRRIVQHFFREGESIDRASMADLLARYDGDVRQSDLCAEVLFDALKAIGVWDESIVVVTADHGQSLGQNDWLGHTTTSEVNLAVPLIMRFPEGIAAPARVNAVVSSIDIMPTVLARFASPAQERFSAQAVGEDLLSGGYARNNAAGEQLARKAERDQLSLRQGSWKLSKVDGGLTLHDLELDPLEREDIAEREPERVDALNRDLQRILGDRGTRAATEITPKVRAELEALGYAPE